MSTLRILVPIDGSASALRALAYAGKRRRHGESVALLVLNVQTPLPPSRYVTHKMLEAHYVRMSNRALRPARAIVRRMKLDAEFVVRRGRPAQVIVRVARAARCTAIMMGTRGRGRVAAAFLGSVAMEVVSLAEIPVTLVR